MQFFKLKYILCLSLGLGLAACSLNKDPLGEYSDVTEGVTEGGKKVTFKNKAEALSYLNTLYQQMRDRQEHWYLDQLLIGDAHADNAYAGTTGAEVIPFENNAIEGSNSVVNRDWRRFLEDIGRANRLIVNVDSVADNSFSAQERKTIIAQGKIFRALVMFDMVRLFGAIPVITTEAGDITAENIEEAYAQYFPKQNTEEEAYAQIEKDCLEALEDAPANNPADKTLFTKSVARTLLAKLYAEKPLRNYAKVIQYADEIAADGFDLVHDFSDLFGMNTAGTDIKMRNTQEAILEAQFVSGSGNWATWMLGRNLINYNQNFTWAKWVTPSRDLIAAFQEEGDLIRYNQSIVYYATNWSNYYPSSNYPFVFKLRSENNSIIKFRYADVLLLKAEALIMQEGANLTAAAAILDKIRLRAQLPPLSPELKANKENMLKALLKERRLELAFEGQRWFDLVRLNKVEEVMNAVFSKDSGRIRLAYPFNQDSYRLPIPQSAIDQNPNLVQNPGY